MFIHYTGSVVGLLWSSCFHDDVLHLQKTQERPLANAIWLAANRRNEINVQLHVSLMYRYRLPSSSFSSQLERNPLT